MTDNDSAKKLFGISGSIIKGFLTTFLIYLVVMAVVFFIFLSILSQRIWYGDEPLYPLLSWINHNRVVFSVLCFSVGLVIIFFINWSKAVRLIADEEKRKSDMIMYLAHDLKTPLSSVIGYLALINDKPDLDEEHRAEYLDISLKKAQRLNRLLDEFFDITKFDVREIKLNKGELDLSLMLEQLADEMYPAMARKGLTFEYEIEPNITVIADSDRLARVFDNLYKNAINYSFAGSPIHVTAFAKGKTAFVKIRNNGTPIPPDDLEKIFEKFYRIGSAEDSTDGGTGLGLAISNEIIRLHGGRINAVSKAEYTEFNVELPL